MIDSLSKNTRERADAFTKFKISQATHSHTHTQYMHSHVHTE